MYLGQLQVRVPCPTFFGGGGSRTPRNLSQEHLSEQEQGFLLEIRAVRADVMEATAMRSVSRCHRCDWELNLECTC